MNGPGNRGNRLLLAHCEALDVVSEELPGSFERLAEEVGADLARLLVFALTGDHRRSHGLLG
jgi:hypothetical protein